MTYFDFLLGALMHKRATPKALRMQDEPAFAGTRTNPKRNAERRAKRILGNRQYRRQTRQSYVLCDAARLG